MCGLGCLINFHRDSRECERDFINSMKTIEHRGPDVCNYLKLNSIYDIGNTVHVPFEILFGHNRLVITDNNRLADQPMVEADKIFLLFNGAIFNYQILKARLITLGASFNTTSDTEVIIMGYKFWGLEIFDLLEGMWSILIYDKDLETIFISRDKFGIKPLFYYKDESFFYFYSEHKQLMNFTSFEINDVAIFDFLNYGVSDYSEFTFFQNVKSFSPGRIYSFEIIKREMKIVGQLQKNESKNNENLIFKSLINAFNVEVPFSLTVSGGLDSSILTVISKESSFATHNNNIYTSVSSDLSNSEETWADLLASELNLNLIKVKTSFEEFKSEMNKIVFHLETPTQSMSAYFNYFVYQKMNADGVRVAYTGQGADELFNGYGQLKYNVILEKYLGKFHSKIANYLDDLLSNFWVFKSHKILISSPVKSHFFKRTKKPFFQRNQIINYFLFVDPLQRYLHWEDKVAMAHSIEARVPFLQTSLYNLAKTLRSKDFNFGGLTKSILRETFKEKLSNKLIYRKDKKGYVNSEEHWILNKYSAEFRNLLIENLDYVREYVKYNEAIENFDLMVKNKVYDPIYWRIIQLAIWKKVFILKEINFNEKRSYHL